MGGAGVDEGLQEFSRVLSVLTRYNRLKASHAWALHLCLCFSGIVLEMCRQCELKFAEYVHCALACA